MILFVKALPAFSAPILDWFSPSKLLTDPVVLKRMGYNQVPQDTRAIDAPYLYWQGPFSSDLGQTANGFSGIKKANFWFFFNSATMTQAGKWAHTVQQAIEDFFNNNPYYRMNTFRINNAIFQDRIPLIIDQTQKTAEEFPPSTMCMKYRFGYSA